MAGSVEKRGENKWRLVVSSGYDANGKRIKHTKTIEATCKSKAEKELALFISEIERGQYVQPSKLIFKEFAEKWLTDNAKSKVEIRTYTTYVDIVKLRLNPEFGHLKLEQIKPLHILDFYKKMQLDGARLDGKTGGLSPKTIRNYHNLLNSIFKDAMHWQLIPFNPVERVEPPKSKRPKINYYDDEQCMELIKLISLEPVKYRTLIMICVYLGFRRGEALGLEWKNIDLENKVFTIEKTVNYASGYGIYEKEPKTDNSVRHVTFSDTIKDLLLNYKIWQDEQKYTMNELYEDSDKLFTQVNGKPMNPDTPTQWFAKFIAKNNLPHITLHGLRHTNASLLIAAGVDARTVSSRLGHSEPAFTMGTYVHMFKKSDQVAADKIDERLNPVK